MAYFGKKAEKRNFEKYRNELVGRCVYHSGDPLFELYVLVPNYCAFVIFI